MTIEYRQTRVPQDIRSLCGTDYDPKQPFTGLFCCVKVSFNPDSFITFHHMEIEVKARLENAKSIKEKLIALGCTFSQAKTQDDMVWVENVGSLDAFVLNKVFLRIRIQNGEKVILTAKKSKEQTGDGSLVKREHEVILDSAEEARGILEMLGLKEAVRVIKTRQTTHYKDFEICIDDIEKLGSFIELEKIGAEEEAEKIQKEMIELLATLGVPANNRIMKGYDILMLEKQL